jgi:2'-5' RNA ligase
MSPTLITDAASRPRPSDPVSLMLRPAPSAARQAWRLAWRLRNEHRLAARPLDEKRLHVTLRGVCRYQQLTRAMVVAIGDVVTALSIPPFLACFDRVMSFGQTGKRPLVLLGDDGVAGMLMLRNELAAAMQKAGFASGTSSYLPHMTLLYDQVAVEEHFVDEVRWSVDEIALVCSLHGRGRHIPLARWKLRR